jgi:asparagine synthetase A
VSGYRPQEMEMKDTYRNVYDATDSADGLVEALEALVDKFDIDRVVSKLADVAYAKAEHLESAWQDNRTARRWEAIGKDLGAVRLLN